LVAAAGAAFSTFLRPTRSGGDPDFLTEARADLRQGIEIPWDEPSPDRQADGINAFRRYACKMATGTGKTTVMAMLAA
jgi:type III restriction enzyme